MRMRRALAVSLSAVSIFALASMAHAQNAPEGAGESDASADAGEIVVTARKRSETLSKVPLSVTAITGEGLEQAGIRTALDLGRETPSLRVTQSLQASDSAQFSLRGQSGGEIQLTIDQPVGMYVDGVNYPRVYGLTAGFFDLERVEVLKGPQGTLYGRNTTGGAINIITKGADYDGTHGYAFVELGNNSSRRVNGAINTVLVEDKLAARFAFQNWTRDGYGKSRITGQDLGGDKNQTFLRGSLRWDPTTSLSVQLKADWLRIRENGLLATGRFSAPITSWGQQAAIEMGLDPRNPADVQTAQAAIQNIIALGSSDFFTADYEGLSFNNLDHHSVGLTIDYDITPDVHLKSISGYRRFTSDRQMDLDATRFHLLTYGVDSPGPVYYPHFKLANDTLYTQEVNLSGDLGNGSIEWLVGGFYSHEKGDDSSTNQVRPNQLQVIAGSPYIVNQTRGIDIFSKSWAIYTQNNWHITDSITATGGLRYSDESKGLTRMNARFAPSTGLYTCTTTSSAVVSDPTLCADKRKKSWNGVSWLASLDWDFSPSSMVYIKASKGFKGGGFDTRPPAPAFDPESAQDIELGFKGRLFDGRLRTNIAVYRTKYSNKQEQAVVPLEITPGVFVATSITTNAASAVIKGLEGDFSARITDNFSIGGNLTYLYGKYKKFVGALNVLNQTVDASGERFSDPRWSYGVNAKYEVPLSNGALSLQGDWYWRQGERPTTRQIDAALPAALLDEIVRRNIGLLNARIEYSIDSADITVALFANNLLDKTWQIKGSSRLATGGVQMAVTQEPRMWGISIRKAFGGE